MKKRLFAILLTIVLVFNVSIFAYADIPDTAPNIPEGYTNYKDFFWQVVKDVGYIGTYPARGLAELVRLVLNSKGMTGEAEQIETDNQAANWLNNGISIDGNGNVVLTGNTLTFVKDFIDYEINDSGYFVGHSYDLIDHIGAFNDGNYFSELRRFVTANQRDYRIFYSYGAYRENGYLRPTIVMVPNNQLSAGLYREANGSYSSYIDLYDTQTWSKSVPTKSYYFSIGGEWTLFDFGRGLTQEYFSVGNQKEITINNLNESNVVIYKFISCNYDSQIRVFTNFEKLQQYGVGISPYYINNTTYTDFKDSNNTYTITNDNRNNIDYGDVTQYINNYYGENDEYPNVQDINIYITNNVPDVVPSPDSPSGGGSSGGGSSGGATASANNEGINININNNHNINFGIPSLSGNSVSGNGSGSSGGFFDWISDIGGVIGDFIKNVGQLLAEAIRGIAEAISSILETVPNVLSSIVEFVYGGLPDELKALVTLGITAVVFVSVIKILRK